MPRDVGHSQPGIQRAAPCRAGMGGITMNAIWTRLSAISGAVLRRGGFRRQRRA